MMHTAGPLRVVVQDRRRLVREGLGMLLAAEHDIEVVCVVARPSDLAAVPGPVDVVLLRDPGCPPANWPARSTRVLLFTDEPPDELVARLRAPAPEGTEAAPRLLALTPREADVMQRVADGLSTGQIGSALGISRKTVENHKQRIFVKLNVRSQAHAVMVSREAGLIPSSRRSEGLHH